MTQYWAAVLLAKLIIASLMNRKVTFVTTEDSVRHTICCPVNQMQEMKPVFVHTCARADLNDSSPDPVKPDAARIVRFVNSRLVYNQTSKLKRCPSTARWLAFASVASNSVLLFPVDPNNDLPSDS